MSNRARLYNTVILIYDDYIRGKTPDEKLFIEFSDNQVRNFRNYNYFHKQLKEIGSMRIVLYDCLQIPPKAQGIQDLKYIKQIYVVKVKSDINFADQIAISNLNSGDGSKLYEKRINEISYELHRERTLFGHCFTMYLKSLSYDTIMEVYENNNYLSELVNNFQNWIDNTNFDHFLNKKNENEKSNDGFEIR